MSRILIVDDEPSIVLALSDELVYEGFEVESAPDGQTAIDRVRSFHPDVMLLDLALPGMNGLEVLRRIRPEAPDLWIIIVSVRDQEVDRVLGLELGSDDYVTKPFSLREIVARVKVALRRQTQRVTRSQYRFGDVEIDIRSHRVTKRGKELAVTRTEFKIIEFFVERAGEVITRDEFLDAIWGENFSITPKVVDTHIALLRKKLEDDASQPKYIVSVRGVGYKLEQALVKP